MVENESRIMTALELSNILCDFAIEIDEVKTIASITSMMLKEFFPNADFRGDRDTFKERLGSVTATITSNGLIKFFGKLGNISGNPVLASLLGTIIISKIFPDIGNEEHINIKEVN